jgi:hypothetical protein
MKTCTIAGLFVVLCLFPRAAHAQVSDIDRATARTLAQEGRDALTRKDYPTAADRFTRASAIVNAPTLLVGLAQAQVGLGKLVSAMETYSRVIREGLPPNPPAPFVRALEEARKGAEALGPRIPFVIVDVKGPTAGASKVVIDGLVVPSAALGMRRPIDPGRHEVRVEAPSFATSQKTFEVAEGKVESVTLVMTPLTGPAAVAPASEPPLHEAPQELPPGAAHGPSGRRVAAFVVGGVGIAGLVVGGATGGLVLGKKGTIQANCGLGGDPAACNHTGFLAASSAKTLGIVSDVGFAVGGAAVVTAVILLVTDHAPKRVGLPGVWIGAPSARGQGPTVGLNGAF